jgi:hypothetical protein
MDKLQKKTKNHTSQKMKKTKKANSKKCCTKQKGRKAEAMQAEGFRRQKVYIIWRENRLL